MPFAGWLQERSSTIGREISILRHPQDGEEFETSLSLLIQFGEKLFDAKFTKDLFVLVLPPFMSEGGKSLWKTIHPNQLGNILGVPAYSVIPSASGGCPEPKGIETARDHVDLH